LVLLLTSRGSGKFEPAVKNIILGHSKV